MTAKNYEHAKKRLAPGDIYEDVFKHPCLCVDVEKDEVWGISLIDGSYPCSCSLTHSGVIRKLSVEEAWKIREGWSKK